jgi:hypothetical protein
VSGSWVGALYATADRHTVVDGALQCIFEHGAAGRIGRDHAGVALPTPLRDLCDCHGDAGVNLSSIGAGWQGGSEKSTVSGFWPTNRMRVKGISPGWRGARSVLPFAAHFCLELSTARAKGSAPTRAEQGTLRELGPLWLQSELCSCERSSMVPGHIGIAHFALHATDQIV